MGAEKAKGIEIDLDRLRHLRFNHNAIAVLEEAVGQPAGKIFAEIANTMGFDLVRKLLYAGLLHEDFALRKKPRDEGIWIAGGLIDEAVGDSELERMSYVQGKITEALVAAFGGSEKNVETPALPGEPVTSGTGAMPSASPSASAG